MRNLKDRVSSLEITVEKLSVKFDALSNKIDNFIEESRRTADRQDARMQKLDERMDTTLKHIQNLVTAAMVGIGAIATAVIAFVATR